jgi:hypothetical protein
MVGMHVRQLVGGKKSSPFHPSLTLSHPHFSINTTMVFMAKRLESEEKNSKEIGRVFKSVLSRKIL